MAPLINRFIKTDCGRAKFHELSIRNGFMSKPRLWWFVAIAALRDWNRPGSDQTSDSAS